MKQGPGKMSQSNAALLQIVTDPAIAAGDVKPPSLSRFPAVPIRVCLLHIDPLRAAGLQAIFEDYVSMKIVVQESTRDDETAIWRDPTVQVAIVGSHAGKAIVKLIASLRACLRSMVLLWRENPRSHMRPHLRCGNQGAWSQESRIQAM